MMKDVFFSTIYQDRAVYMVGYECGQTDRNKPVVELIDQVFTKRQAAAEFAAQQRRQHTRLHVLKISLPKPLAEVALD